MAARKSRHKGSQKMIAPDGGWGWMIVLGVSISNFSTRSLEPSFGLLFGDLLQELKVETTGAAIIMSTMDAMINFSGMFVGPLMKKYSYRQVAFFGGALSAFGLFCTAPANTMAHIVVTYSIIRGLGAGLAWSSTLVALNHYFSKRRGQAVGLSMAGTATGLMLMPQAVQLLLQAYAFSGAVMVLGAIGLNALVGSVLLQPVEWHMVPHEEPPRQSEDSESEENKPESASMLQVAPKIAITPAGEKINLETEAVEKIPVVRTRSGGIARKRRESCKSVVSSTDFAGSAFHIQANSSDDDDDQIDEKFTKIDINENGEGINSKKEDMKKKKNGCFQQVVNFMDLDLLKDPIYLNIIFGISLFFVAEVNFKMVVPFFLADLGYTKSETAFFLSMMAVTDIVARVVLPPICDRIGISRRALFATSGIFLGVSRSIMAEQTGYAALLTAIIVSGLFRGSTLINCSLSISDYCSLEKLPAAFGLHMVAKGIFTAVLGPLIGVIRDVTGSYPICIHAQTVLIFACATTWGVEYLIRRKRIK